MSEIRSWRPEDGGQMSECEENMWKEERRLKSAKDLRVYKKAYDLAMTIFRLSKTWPGEEKFSLTDQIRRSSRSVCANPALLNSLRSRDVLHLCATK